MNGSRLIDFGSKEPGIVDVDINDHLYVDWDLFDLHASIMNLFNFFLPFVCFSCSLLCNEHDYDKLKHF